VVCIPRGGRPIRRARRDERRGAASSSGRPCRADRSTPLFLIYAGHGGGGEELNPDYFEAAAQPKTLWKFEEAGHVGGFNARPDEYEKRVTGFFDRALLEQDE
jgi:hypothetical protein